MPSEWHGKAWLLEAAPYDSGSAAAVQSALVTHPVWHIEPHDDLVCTGTTLPTEAPKTFQLEPCQVCVKQLSLL